MSKVLSETKLPKTVTNWLKAGCWTLKLEMPSPTASMPWGSRRNTLILFPMIRLEWRQKITPNVFSVKCLGAIKTGNDKADAPPKEEADVPPKWFFTGHWAFLLFGPHLLSGETLSCVEEDFKKAKKQSRQEMRKQESMQKDKERQAGHEGECPDACRRGVPVKDKATAAQMAHSDRQFRMKNVRDLLALAQNDHALTMKQLSETTLIVNAIEDDDEADEEAKAPLKKNRNKTILRLSEIAEKKRKLEEESDVLRNLKTDAQVLAHHQQVGDFVLKSEETPAKKQKPLDGSVVVANNKDDASAITESSPNDKSSSDGNCNAEHEQQQPKQNKEVLLCVDCLFLPGHASFRCWNIVLKCSTSFSLNLEQESALTKTAPASSNMRMPSPMPVEPTLSSSSMSSLVDCRLVPVIGAGRAHSLSCSRPPKPSRLFNLLMAKGAGISISFGSSSQFTFPVTANATFPFLVQSVNLQKHVVWSTTSKPHIICGFGVLESHSCLEDAETTLQNAKAALHILAERLNPFRWPPLGSQQITLTGSLCAGPSMASIVD